jgi:hypothetical protein
MTTPGGLAMIAPAAADHVLVEAVDAPGPVRGWHLVVALVRVICVLMVLLSAFALDSVRYWLKQANGPVLTYRQADDRR